MERNDIIDILDILYRKIIRLNYSYSFTSIFVVNGLMENRFPDMTYVLKCSFGIDFYTTINPLLFKKDKYTFGRLANENEEFNAYLEKSKNRMLKLMPKFNKVRNQQICHFDEKQNECHMNDVILNFPQVFPLLTELHKEAMRCFNVKYDEIKALSSNDFSNIFEEYSDFNLLLNNALIEYCLKSKDEK